MDLSLSSRSLTWRSFRSRKARCLDCYVSNLAHRMLCGGHTLLCSEPSSCSGQVSGCPCLHRCYPGLEPGHTLDPHSRHSVESSSCHKAVRVRSRVDVLIEEARPAEEL